MLDPRKIVRNNSIGVLTYLQLGRAYAMKGDTANAKAGYRDFQIPRKMLTRISPSTKKPKAEHAKPR